jgi:hypothetical protein
MSSAPCFECFRSEVLAQEKKKKRGGRSKTNSRRIQEKYSQWFGNTYLDDSSSSTEKIATLRFRAMTLGPLVSDLYYGSPPGVCSGSRFVGEGDRRAKNLMVTQRRKGFR